MGKKRVSAINETTRQKVIDIIIEVDLDINRDDPDGMEYTLRHGFSGYLNWSDKELMEFFRGMIGLDDCNDEEDIVAHVSTEQLTLYRQMEADIAVHKMLLPKKIKSHET